MIVVTGAAGHVGRAVVDRLVEAGGPVRVMTRDSSRLGRLPPQVEIAVADLDDPATLDAATSGGQAMYLMAVDEGTTQTADAVRAAVDAGMSHVQHSSLGVGVEPMIPASQYHLDRERVLQESGLNSTILRCGLFMSNVLAWVDAIRREGVARHSTVDARSGRAADGDVDHPGH
jgi:uncharacterized protein YbjT (DUF2867 family)